MAKQTKQQKLQQIEKDINRLGINDEKTKELVKKTLGKLDSYSQNTGPLVARRISELGKDNPSEIEIQKIVAEGNKFEQILETLHGSVLAEFGKAFLKKDGTGLMEKYPKLFAAVTKILPTQKSLEDNLGNIYGFLISPVVGNVNGFGGTCNQTVQKELIKHQDNAMSKNSPNAYMLYYTSVALPELCIKYAKDIQKTLGLDVKKMKEEEEAKVAETKRKIKEEKMKNNKK